MTRPLDWPDRVDVTEEALGDPAFWVTFCRVDQVFLDAAVDQNAYYASFLMRRIDAGRWPFIRADVGGTKYVEAELTDDHELRLWIGDRRVGRRVLLGIESGHDELPAFRPEELEWIVERLAQDRRVLGLLLAIGCSFPDYDESKAHALLRDLARRVPGVHAGAVGALATDLLRLTGESLWTRDGELGWVCRTGRRDPHRGFDQLPAADFRFIREFFA